jgi:hypothetical protein
MRRTDVGRGRCCTPHVLIFSLSGVQKWVYFCSF